MMLCWDTSQAAERNLKSHGDGAYLFREARGKIVISLQFRHHVTHHQLELPANLSFKEVDKSLRKFVKQYSARKVAALPCLLKEYITSEALPTPSNNRVSWYYVVCTHTHTHTHTHTRARARCI